VPTLTPGQGQDLLSAFKRASERRDVDLAMSLFREDAEYRLDPFEPALTGANAIRAYWNDFAATWTNVEFDSERVWVAGNTVLSSWHSAMTSRGSAERLRFRGFMTFELDDAGLVSRFKQWPVARKVGVDSTVDPEAAPAGEAARGR
jgi:ketosteroid isomerase-like protein